MAALWVITKQPVGEASVVLERLTRVQLPRATLDREARRQGQRAQALRRQLDQLADDRFPQARQRLDFDPAGQHLAVVGRAVGGEDPAKLKAWLKPLVKQLQSESAVKEIRRLEAGTATPKS